jgi:hypothetical protein
MITRTLKAAVEKIEKAQAEHPEIYAGFQRDIDKVKADMKALAERIPKYRKGPA